MANYNLTNQTISSSFSQLLQKDTDTEKLVDGVGTPIVDLTISGSTTSGFFIGDGSQLTNTPQTDTPAGTISGSSQVDYPEISNIPAGIVSGSEQLPAGIISGSEQLPNGLVSGSSQVDVLQTTNIDRIATTGSNTFDGNQVVSGSVTIQDTNAPMSGLVLKNNAGGGDVQIIPAGDSVTTFNDATLTGIAAYGGQTLSGSWGEAGNIGGVGVGVSSTSEPTVLKIGTYETFEASTTGETRIFGNTIKLQPSSSAGTSVQVTGDVSASNFTGSFTGDGSSLTNLTLPSGLVSGSSQVIINDVNGFTAYSQSVDTRLDTAEVEINSLQIVTGSYATTGSNIFNGLQTITGSLIVGQQGFLDEGLTVPNNAEIGNYLNVGKGLFVTQSNFSSLGSIILTYPFTGSGGSTGQVTQKFDDYGGGTSFEQSITGVDFSYFKAQDGGLLFSTENSGEIKFFSADNMQLNAPTTVVNSNLQLDLPAGGSQAVFQMNPNYSSTGKGIRARWRPNSADGRAEINIDESTSAQLTLTAASGSFPSSPGSHINSMRTLVDSAGVRFRDFNGSGFFYDTFLTIPPNFGGAKPNFNRGLEVTGATLSNIQTITTSGGFAVIDMNVASLFEVTLDAGSVTTFDAANVNIGQTVRLLVNQNATTLGTVTLDSKFKQPDGSPYVATTTLGAQDMLTFTCYNDTNSIYVIHENKFV